MTWKTSYADIDDRFPNPVMDAGLLVNPFFDNHWYSEGLERNLKRLGDTDDLLEINLLTGGILEFQERALELGQIDRPVIDVGAVRGQEEIGEILGYVAMTFYCEIHGGCSIEHPHTLVLCIHVGCESDLNDYLDVVYRTISPREAEVVDRLLDLLRAQRRSPR